MARLRVQGSPTTSSCRAPSLQAVRAVHHCSRMSDESCAPLHVCARVHASAAHASARAQECIHAQECMRGQGRLCESKCERGVQAGACARTCMRALQGVFKRHASGVRTTASVRRMHASAARAGARAQECMHAQECTHGQVRSSKSACVHGLQVGACARMRIRELLGVFKCRACTRHGLIGGDEREEMGSGMHRRVERVLHARTARVRAAAEHLRWHPSRWNWGGARHPSRWNSRAGRR